MPGSFWVPDSHIKRRKSQESSGGFRSALLPNKGLCCDSQRSSFPRSLKLALKVTLLVQKAQYSHVWWCIHVYASIECIIVIGTIYFRVNKTFSGIASQSDCTWPHTCWCNRWITSIVIRMCSDHWNHIWRDARIRLFFPMWCFITWLVPPISHFQ